MSLFNQLKQDFLQLSKKYQITILALFSLAFLARFINYFHLGYVYDLISTQYAWAKSATDNGFVGFWRDYQDSLDYLPGAIYLGMVMQYINKFAGLFGIGGNEYGFVFVLKAFNTLNDLTFAYLLYHIGKKYASLSGVRLFVTPVISIILPSLWFISSVWGQFDTFPVNLCIISSLLLYHAQQTKKLDYGSFAGLVFGISLGFKLQSILIFPPLIIMFITFRNRELVFRFVSAFVGTLLATLIVPLIANANRTGFVLAQVVIRSNNVSNGASSFWPLVDMRKYGTDLWFSLGNLDITASKVSYLVYILAMSFLIVQILPSVKNIFSLNPKKVWSSLSSLPELSYLHFSTIMMVSSSVYFFFFTKMMSRYLQFGFLFALIFLTIQTNTRRFKHFLLAILITEIGYLINQVGIYGFYNDNPIWTQTFEKGVFGIDKVWLGSWFNLVGIVSIYVLSISYTKQDRKIAKP
jgi:hypothetical protein